MNMTGREALFRRLATGICTPDVQLLGASHARGSRWGHELVEKGPSVG